MIVHNYKFNIPGSGEDIVKLLFKCGRVLQRPISFILVDKNDIFENSLRDAH